MVGANDDVFKERGPATTVIDANGRSVIPGLIYFHMHPIEAA
jgi:predicted amidohydrolase YtcJ